ncbi:MAG: hypothetical protein KKB30_10835 [Proteobacteria bacterium]|nr:hypothetical protein [Pseudomonadota bacterium]MBU1714526.1 hypothetical protein [Pseudomonadota bacterium]
MNYPYSQANRIEEPHSYMYTPFNGESLLHAHQSSRMNVLQKFVNAESSSLYPDQMFVAHALPTIKKLFDTSSLAGGQKFCALLEGLGGNISRQDIIESSALAELTKDINKFRTNDSVKTSDLLHSLVAIQLADIQDIKTKTWLDRMVQRFEVTKKIYESYSPGFRKGEGSNTSVRLYWLFALALSLYYAESNEIKYLSTLLKICDLLCSLPKNMLQEHIPRHGLPVVLATEMVSVQLLAEQKGVAYATK